MNQLLALLPSWLGAFLEQYKYAALFAGAYLEGPVVMMTGGFLLKVGELSFWPTYLSLVFGDFASDLTWYFVGLLAARPLIMHWGKWLGITRESVEKMEKIFAHYNLPILVVSKLTMGFGLSLATLTTAGMLRISLIRYAAINLSCGFIWTLLMIIIGYFFGNIFSYVPSQFQVIFLIVMLIAWFFGLRYAAKRAANAYSATSAAQ